MITIFWLWLRPAWFRLQFTNHSDKHFTSSKNFAVAANMIFGDDN
jgi:hypothetical protein